MNRRTGKKREDKIGSLWKSEWINLKKWFKGNESFSFSSVTFHKDSILHSLIIQVLRIDIIGLVRIWTKYG